MSEARTYTIAEVIEITKIPRSTMYRQAAAGKCDHLGAVRIGSKTVFKKSVIDRLFPPSEVAS